MILKRLILVLMISLLGTSPLYGAYEGEGEGPYDYDRDKKSGWFVGTDQGVLFFVGNSSKFMNAQYYGITYGGYNIKGYVQPMARLGSAFGSSNEFFNPSTYFFIFEGGARFTPLRTMVRPFFSGTAGVYILNFDDFATVVRGGSNFTYSGGGGVEIAFGPSRLTIGGEYRGFLNSGINLQGVGVTLGYYYQF